MRLAALAELHVAGILELRSQGVTRARFRLELDPRAADGDGVPRKKRSRKGEAELVEELRAAVAATSEIPILHMIFSTPSSIAERNRSCASATAGWSPELVVGRELRDRLEGETRADRVGAEAEQARERVRIARVVRDDDERAERAQPLVDEPLVHRANREQRRNRDAVALVARSTSSSSPRRTAATASSASTGERSRERLVGECRVDRRPRHRIRIDEEGRQLAQLRRRTLCESGARAPSSVVSEKTCRSRRWSIGGFVACAKRWRKYE